MLDPNDYQNTGEDISGKASDLLKNIDPKKLPSKGDAFLNGSATTAFSNLGSNKLSLGVSVVGAGVLADQMTNSEIEELVKDMATAALSKIAEETGKLLGEYTSKSATLVASIPSKIVSETNKRVSSPEENEEKIHDVNFYLNQKTTSQETRIEEDAKKNEEERKSEGIKNTQEKVSSAINTANDLISKANERINDLQKYALEGPVWVADQMDKAIQDGISQVKKQLDDNFKSLETDVNAFCAKEGKQIGSKIVQKTNAKLDQLASQMKNKTEKAVSETKIKSKSAIQKAKLAVMAQVGC